MWHQKVKGNFPTKKSAALKGQLGRRRLMTTRRVT
jgi:hypothetical protein